MDPGFKLSITFLTTAAQTCTFEGPQVPNGYVFDLDGFSNVPGLFDYDCSFTLAAPISAACK